MGYAWINTLKSVAEHEVSNDEFLRAVALWPTDTPTTKEAFLYRRIFDEMFKNKAAAQTVRRWEPTWGASKDPSGRAQGVHDSAFPAAVVQSS